MKKYRKALIFILIIIIGVILNRKLQWSPYLTDSNNLKIITNFVRNNYILSIFLYLVFTIVGASILALPGVTFAVLASGLFGLLDRKFILFNRDNHRSSFIISSK